MISKIDILREHRCSWMFYNVIVEHTKSRVDYIKKAINDTSNEHYGIIICNTLVDITEFKNTFKNNKKEFIKLCYNTIKGCIYINIARSFNYIRQIMLRPNKNIIFE